MERTSARCPRNPVQLPALLCLFQRDESQTAPRVEEANEASEPDADPTGGVVDKEMLQPAAQVVAGAYKLPAGGSGSER